MNNGNVYELPDPPDYKRILDEQGSEAYVRRLVVQYGPRIAASYDLRLFRQIRRHFAGAQNVEVDRLFLREMSKELPQDLQEKLIQELPRSYRKEVEQWNKMPFLWRFFLRLRR
jgi:hypothetical protein